jgi:phage tail sheath protein FI
VPSLAEALISHCESLKNRFAIIDSIKGQTPSNVTKPRSTSYAALYYPWLNVADSATSTRLVPPGGHVAGIYARIDLERGVQKAPANAVVQGTVSLEFPISNSQQDSLNLDGINCIRSFPGRGITVWGARTLSVDSLWKYASVRRLFTYLENSILKGTQWVIFEPNNQTTWTKAIGTITEFLRTAWKNGALQGTKPEEAFFVKCDRTTMTQGDIDSGKIMILIGVAVVKPAEFIVFRVNHSIEVSGLLEG